MSIHIYIYIYHSLSLYIYIYTHNVSPYHVSPYRGVGCAGCSVARAVQHCIYIYIYIYVSSSNVEL